ncbi:uncharacterized protein LOC124486661 [Hypomesus transpacificus]|uniref:uncharacterized protein LOC124486661 n=1 Tax=Hypomesus transpacificus TaxID=137520 RepID=UPI001F080951|nr:uncharacterized protein LOC124486661 [Hypomesus transpacificus]
MISRCTSRWTPPEMYIVPSEGLDEAHCFGAMCPHPCCWETEHRIGRGIHRQLRSQTSDKGRPAVEVSSVGGFPTLSVVNVSEWAQRRKHPQVKLVSEADSKEDVPASPLLSCQSQILQRKSNKSHLCRMDGHFPDLNSVTLIDSNRKKEVKLRTANISQLTSSESCSLMMWIPPQHTQKCLPQTRSKSPHLAMKEIICHPSTPSNKSDNLNRKSARKKIHVRFTPLPPQRGSRDGSGSVDPTDTHADADSQGEESSVAQLTQEHEPGAVVHGPSPRPQPTAPLNPRGPSPRPPSTPAASGAFLVRNKPVVFHCSSVRLPRSTSQHNLPVYKLKLDTETGVDDIDWERLRRQTYLWKKRNLPAYCNRERPAPAPLRGDMTDSPQGFGLYPVPNTPVYNHPKSILSTGPSFWRGTDSMDGICYNHAGPEPPESTYHLSDLSDSGLKLCDSPSLCQNLDQALDTDGLRDLSMSSRGSIAPQNSMVLQDPAVENKCSEEEGAGFGTEGDGGLNPGAPEKTSSSAEDQGSGPSAPLPRPALCRVSSETCGDG